MKKLTAALLILLLVTLCVPAFAANTNGLGDTVARNAELAAFLDGSGNIYVSGLDRPVNATKADSLISIDPYRILFFAKSDAGVPQGRVIALSLQENFPETVVTDDAYAACLDEENVYYISRANRAQLVCYNLDSKNSRIAFTGTEELDRVYSSSIGVVVTQIAGSGTYITDSITGQFIPYAGDAAQQIEQGDGFEVYLTDSANLFVRKNGALSPAMVDSAVRAWAIVGHNLYYLCGNDGALSLKHYSVDANLWNFILSLPADIEPQLTASENSLFVLSRNNIIYSVDVANARLITYATLAAPQSYALSGARNVSGYRIEAVSGQLNLYGVVESSNTTPTFTFVGTNQGAQSATSGYELLSAYAIDSESTVWTLLQPAAPYSPLRRGSRGAAVSAIQQPLADLGYYNYYIDGIFGWRTERAVKLLQDALGLRVTGVADEDLQRRILAGGLPAYDPYRALRFGDRGLRVTEMQQRLRDLGYLADDADGVFGERTLAAVELFQSEHGLHVDGVAGSETLRLLYSSNAQPCSSYIDLRRGDSGYRVRELNRRLKELYYLEGSVGSTYTSATAEAVRRFQQEVGMRQTGEATVAVQRELFSRYAPEYSGYITLRRGDDNDRVLEMQRRLRDLGYYDGPLDGYFGKATYQAVRDFQHRAGLKVTGVADPTTLRRLYAADAPAYQEPEILSDPTIWFTDEFETDENGVYLIPVATGSVQLTWSADGAASYDVRFDDGSGSNPIDWKNIAEEALSFNSGDISFHQDTVYTVTVTAHPNDTLNNGDTSASIRFRIVPAPVAVTTVTITVTSTVSKDPLDETLNVVSGDEFSCMWSADGEVASFDYSVTEDETTAIDSGSNVTELALRTEILQEGHIYTLTVTAHPLDGGSDVTETLRFRLPTADELNPTEPTPGDPGTGETTPTGDPNDPNAQPGIVGEGGNGTTDGNDANGDGDNGDGADNGDNGANGDGDNGANGDNGDNGDGDNGANGDGADNGDGTNGGDAANGDGTNGDSANGDGSNGGDTTNGDGTNGDGDGADNGDGANGGEPVEGADNGGEEFNGGYVGAPATVGNTYSGVNAGDGIAPEGGDGFENSMPEAAPASDPVIQAGPITGEIPMDVVNLDGSVSSEAVVTIADTPLTLSWAAEGDVAGYNVRITDESGTAMVDENLSNTGAQLSTEYLVPNEVYTLTATAYFNSGEVTSSSLYFMLPGDGSEESTEEPAIQETEVEEPYVEEPYVEQPAIEEPYVEESYVEEPYVEEPYVEEPYVEEPYVEEPYVEEPYVEEPYVEEPYVEEPYVEEPYVEEPYVEEPYVEEPYVEEPYVEEPYVEEPYVEEPVEESSDWYSYIDSGSDPSAIAAVQQQLSSWGWLGGYSSGTLDGATVQAVIDFQYYCIENGMDVSVTDAGNPVIGADTLNLLFGGYAITRP